MCDFLSWIESDKINRDGTKSLLYLTYNDIYNTEKAEKDITKT